MGYGFIRLLAMSALAYVGWWIYRDLKQQLRPKSEDQPNTDRSAQSAREVLGVDPSANSKEIKSAYQALVQQYHPDRVADMGPELREVAERRTKEINAAYSTLKKAR